ncbi:cytochrome C oxidase subunit IV family protein [Sediminitomix flava]|uniref:Cytochrome c oxidase subunit IV n=1 Tax=Sediminitomix flava TaxID=379075 RepID=A0A315ZCI1_SEDFL|nr:cytochrome C oxidase subunit IV family protein [Sediminitomix flava]PWJ42528.1 cytochrome c oxidase subunit IV [Sediminitomix flava]
MANVDSTLSMEEQKKANVRKIWKVAGYLAVITAIEFLFAFIYPDSWDRLFLNITFVIMTLVKAYYIMSEFMHLGHEVKFLQRTVVYPLAFLIWLLVALFLEGGAVLKAIASIWG